MKKYVCDVCGYVYDPAAGDPDNGSMYATCAAMYMTLPPATPITA